MRLRDRFGDSGLTGILIAFIETDELHIDNWLISCRVLGRGVEQLMLSAAVDFARGAGCRQIIGEYIPTAKNQQVADIYSRFGFDLAESQSSGARVYRANPKALNIPKPVYIKTTDSTQMLQAQASSAGPEV
jgi:predicted enzyme involved in methoxymalonyl-ACP biosynthesis